MEDVRDGQAETFDQLGIPYEYHKDVGVIVGTRRAGCGEGRWVFDNDLNIQEQMERPYPIVETLRARNKRCEEARIAIQQWSERWNRERAERAACNEHEASESSEINSEDSDGLYDQPQTIVAKQTPHRPSNTPLASELKRRRSKTSSDDAGLFLQCIIQEKARSNGRIDYTIITPDGKRFRSKTGALDHMKKSSELLECQSDEDEAIGGCSANN